MFFPTVDISVGSEVFQALLRIPAHREHPFRFNLNQEQIDLLLAELITGRNKDTYRVALLALATGARWSEAETLRAEYLSVKPALVTFVDTKGKRNRSVPISAELAEYFKIKATGRLFKDCYAAFRNSIDRVDIALPQGQLTHVLRHTFASHFMINGGNIITLQRILGHTSLVVTMKYAHMAPNHLQDAIKYNPVHGRHIVNNSVEGTIS